MLSADSLNPKTRVFWMDNNYIKILKQNKVAIQFPIKFQDFYIHGYRKIYPLIYYVLKIIIL